MLIRKPELVLSSAQPPRFEHLLSLYEKNLLLEVFFIERKDIESLLELLPAQGDLITAITGILAELRLHPLESDLLQKRLEAADALREKNKLLLDEAMQEVSSELEQMNGARQRIRQVRQLSKSMYQEPSATPRLQNWA